MGFRGWMTQLTPAAKNGRSPSDLNFLPLRRHKFHGHISPHNTDNKTRFLFHNYRAFICWTAAGGKVPFTTEIFTPAFSNTCPSWIIHVIPPPPSFLNHRSTWKRFSFVSSASKALHSSACGEQMTKNIIGSLPIQFYHTLIEELTCILMISNSILVFISDGLFSRTLRSVIVSAMNITSLPPQVFFFTESMNAKPGIAAKRYLKHLLHTC